MKKIVLSIIGNLLLYCVLFAAPALRNPVMVTQSDGTKLWVYLQGDEAFNYSTTRDGVVVMRNKLGDYCYAQTNEYGEFTPSTYIAHEAMMRTQEEVSFIKSISLTSSKMVSKFLPMALQPQRTSSSQSTALIRAKGSPRIPLILIQYSDLAFMVEDVNSFYHKHCNGVNHTEGRYTGSVRDYFADQSNGQFTPVFDVIGPVTLDKPMAYYGENNDQGRDFRHTEMIREAIRKAKAMGVDFSIYDLYDKNEIPLVYTIYAGFGENMSGADPNTIWPKQGTMNYTIDGKTLTSYACNNELVINRGDTIVDGIGVFCHEFSHCLGLPDFYNTNSASDIFGMSWWSVMDYGLYYNSSYTPIGYTSYEREFMGWMESEILNDPRFVTLPSLGDSHKAYRIVNEANPNEYYLLENRQPSKWFPAIIGTGMLILHVDYNASIWSRNAVNNEKSRQRMTIIPADGSLVKENNPAVRQLDYQGDTYPGFTLQRALTNDSSPSAAAVNTGGFMGKPITDISETNGLITFNFMGGDPTLIENAIDNATTEMRVDIYSLDGRLVVRNLPYNSINSHLSRGIYISKSRMGSTKIVVN